MATGSAACSGCSSTPRSRTPSSAPEIFRNFVFDVCGCAPTWSMRACVEQVMEAIRTRRPDRKVFFLISGGVDFDGGVLLLLPGARAGPRPRPLRRHRASCGRATPRPSSTFREAGHEAIHVGDRSADFFERLAAA